MCLRASCERLMWDGRLASNHALWGRTQAPLRGLAASSVYYVPPKKTTVNQQPTSTHAHTRDRTRWHAFRHSGDALTRLFPLASSRHHRMRRLFLVENHHRFRPRYLHTPWLHFYATCIHAHVPGRAQHHPRCLVRAWAQTR